MNVTEIIGYAASLFVAISLLMVSIVRLRVINLIGCAIFVVYGTIIGSIPIVITNGFIAIVNGIFLYKALFWNIDSFTYLPVSGERQLVLEHFIDTNLEDIHSHYPLFEKTRAMAYIKNGGTAFIALRDLSIVGFAIIVPADLAVSMGSKEELYAIGEGCSDVGISSCAYIPVDYIAKPYRDMGVAEKLYAEIAAWIEPPARFLVTIAQTKQKRHRRYLKTNQFAAVWESESLVLYSKHVV